jgi:hypothetical protein
MGMARASRPLLMALKPAPNREHCVERVGASGIVNGVVNCCLSTGSMSMKVHDYLGRQSYTAVGRLVMSCQV